MLWHHNRTYRFVLDIESDAVMFPGMLPATLPSQLVRELQAYLRHDDCIDPQRGESRMFVQHGALTLSVTVKGDAYEYCTEYLVRLADRVLGSILEQPAYDRYRANSLTINSNAAEYA
jgi:hypothetical protein